MKEKEEQIDRSSLTILGLRATLNNNMIAMCIFAKSIPGGLYHEEENLCAAADRGGAGFDDR